MLVSLLPLLPTQHASHDTRGPGISHTTLFSLRFCIATSKPPFSGLWGQLDVVTQERRLIDRWVREEGQQQRQWAAQSCSAHSVCLILLAVECAHPGKAQGPVPNLSPEFTWTFLA